MGSLAGSVFIVKVSVIIPVYNGEKYLRKCIDSVLGQTFRDYELILVEDGSKDSTGQLCDEYALADSRVRVIHKRNEGLICARKDGIASAKGELIAFVDADDWIEEDFLEILVENMVRNQADIVITGCVKERGHVAEILSNGIPDGIYEAERVIQNIFPCMLHYEGFYRFGILPYMWNKLYKKDILRKCYQNINTDIYDGEDAAVVYPYLLKVKKAVVLSVFKYHYRIHEQAMTALKKSDYYENCCFLYLHLVNEFKKTGYLESLLPQLDQYLRMMVWQGSQERFIEAEKYIFPFHKVPKDSAIILYGAGVVGQTYYYQIKKTGYCQISAWVDRNYQRDELRNLGVTGETVLEEKEYQFIVIAIENLQTVEMVIDDMQSRGISKGKIIY